MEKVLNQTISERFALYHGDSCEVLTTLPSDSVDYIIFSPPFASLYTYSNSERDLGNSKSYEQFFAHYAFITRELFRVLKPGRLLSFHCMLMPTTKSFHGYIGLQDFRGDLIRAHQKDGFIHHSEVVIWKDPVIAMQRTKAIGLLHKQVCKDSCMSRQGIPDYVITMRKPGENCEPCANPFAFYIGEPGTGPTAHDPIKASIETWQRYASPVWMDIDPSDTLQRESAREHNDERHICPLQLQVIKRALHLWTNPNDLVLSPFAGIGSEGYAALQMNRRFVGCELKESYYKQAALNLKSAEAQQKQEVLI